MDLTSSLEVNFGARQGPAKFTNKVKKLGKFFYHKMQKLGKIQSLGSYLKFRGQNLGYLSPLFWGQNLGLQQECQRQILGPSAPDLLI